MDKKIQELRREQTVKLLYEALRFNDSVYHHLIFETGLDWIRNNMSLNDDEVVNVIAECRLFWSWWRFQWALRDDKFVYQTSLIKQDLPLDEKGMLIALDVYYETHHVRNVKLIPNKWVIEEITTALKRLANREMEKLKTLLNNGK